MRTFLLTMMLTTTQALAQDFKMYRINWDYGGFAAFGVISETQLKYCHVWEDPGSEPISEENCGIYPYTRMPSGLLEAKTISDGTATFKIFDEGRKANASFLNDAGKFYFAEQPN